jgi:diguanylate cyclase (GGDEF)-like protein
VLRDRARRADIQTMEHSSWLFPDGADRERMLELDRQLRPVRAAVIGVLAVSLLVSGPWLGWWTIAPVLAAVGVFRLADEQMDRMRRPEWALFGAWAASEVIMAVSIAISGSAGVPTAAWLAIPVLTLGARFSARGIVLGVGVAIALLLAVDLGVNGAAVAANPPLLIAPAALIACVAMFQTVLMRSEIRLRGEAVIDPLTGLLNRRALERRVDELEQQSRLTLQQVGLVAGDIDHFKQFNDEHGHQAGDALLVEVAERLRRALRAFDFCYRTGGEEFLVVLPGATVEDAARLAETLRREVAAVGSDGERVTMSFGVAASSVGAPFDYGRVFAQADAELYEAKRGGRNRVSPRVASATVRAA